MKTLTLGSAIVGLKAGIARRACFAGLALGLAACDSSLPNTPGNGCLIQSVCLANLHGSGGGDPYTNAALVQEGFQMMAGPRSYSQPAFQPPLMAQQQSCRVARVGMSTVLQCF